MTDLAKRGTHYPVSPGGVLVLDGLLISHNSHIVKGVFRRADGTITIPTTLGLVWQVQRVTPLPTAPLLAEMVVLRDKIREYDNGRMEGDYFANALDEVIQRHAQWLQRDAVGTPPPEGCGPGCARLRGVPHTHG